MPVTETETRYPSRGVFHFSPPKAGHRNVPTMSDSTMGENFKFNSCRLPKPIPETRAVAYFIFRSESWAHRGHRRQKQSRRHPQRAATAPTAHKQRSLAEKENDQPRPEEDEQHSGDSTQHPTRTTPSGTPHTATTPAHTGRTEGAAQPKERRDPPPPRHQSGGRLWVEKEPPSEGGETDGTDEPIGRAGSRQTGRRRVIGHTSLQSPTFYHLHQSGNTEQTTQEMSPTTIP